MAFQKNDPLCKEAGRKGGKKTAETLGTAHYSAIGKMGGETRKEQIGREGFAAIGALGGHNGRGRKRKSAE